MTMLEKVKPLVRISCDEMEAYIMLPVPEDGETYTTVSLMQTLKKSGVCVGIDRDALNQLCAGNLYDTETVVARGIQAGDGIDGYYEYHFNASLDRKPKMLPDGSVDYSSVHTIEEVTEGQVIATYHPAVEGADGLTVKGSVLTAKKAREQMPLKGKGFERTNGDLTYVSLMDGKIEFQNDRIMIKPIHEISGNAEISGGNIDFRGDIVIHGNVESGVKIKATGTITVDGMVEAAELEAGKDILIRGGMVGGNKASVKTKGNIVAKFFEYTAIECEGNIQADVLIDCTVACQGKVTLIGSNGRIIGGEVKAIEGIEVSSLGNRAEKKTVVFVGLDFEMYERYRVLEKNIQETKGRLGRIEEGLQKFNVLSSERGVSYANDPRRMTLLRVKIRETAALASDEAEAKKLKMMMERSTKACVSVWKKVYSDVTLHFGDMKYTTKNTAECVEFYRRPDKIATRTCVKEK